VNLSRRRRVMVVDMKDFPLAILAGLLVSSAMLGATDVSGRWSGFPIYLTLKQDGNTVTGSAGESEDDQVPFQSGSIEDDRLTLKFGPMEINLVVQGDQMSGEVHQGTQTMKMVFRRMKPRDPSAPPPAFDVASVKRSPPQPLGKGGSSNMRADPGRLTCTNVPLKRYLMAAWGLKDYQVSAPDWMNDEHYELTATMPAGTPPHEVLLMLQGLLVDRFKLATHRETKELAVYALVVDRNGLKLKPAEGFGTSVSSSPKGRSMRANVTMKSFAGTLSSFLDRPVVDMTGLTGGFNINLEWAPDEMPSNPNANEGRAGDGVPGPTIYTALHEVGLKLESRKAPVEILVVDRAEKVPVEN
jgi:uncharacterized protein (TIGR03435 family)